MTGYVRIYKPDMRFRDYETYKSVYCSLCRELGKKYSVVARFFLSYDYTLLALINMSLSSNKPNFCQNRCVANPLKKCNYCNTSGNEISYSAAVSVVLTNYKVCDNIEDSGIFKSLAFRFLHLFTKNWSKKAIIEFPDLEKIISDYIKLQRQAEQNENCSLDKASHPTANALAEIFSACSNNRLEQENLKRFGYCLGKWIYLLDAVDDINKDRKSGNFNPLKEIENIKEYCEPLLNNCEVECGNSFDLLEVKKFKLILENIVFQGLKFSKEKVFQKEK